MPYDHCLHVLEYDMQYIPAVYHIPPTYYPRTGRGICCKCGNNFRFKERVIKDPKHGKYFNHEMIFVDWENMLPDCPEKPIEHIQKPVTGFKEEDFTPGTLLLTYMNKLCKVLSLSKNKTLVHLLLLDDTQCTFYELVDKLCEQGYIVCSRGE